MRRETVFSSLTQHSWIRYCSLKKYTRPAYIFLTQYLMLRVLPLALVWIGAGFCTMINTDSLLGPGALGLSNDLFPANETALFAKPLYAQNQDSSLTIALALLNKGEYDTAIARAKRFINRFPNSSAAYEIIGAGLAMKGKLDEGLSALRKAVEINPRQGSALTKIGDIYLAKQEYDAAKKTFLKAIECSPNDRWAHQRLGLLYEKEKDSRAAIEHYEKGILGTDPNYIGIKVNLANLYNSAGRYDKTLKLLQALITKEVKNSPAHMILGVAYLGLQKNKDAIREYQIAREYAVKDPHAALALGISYRAAGDYENSEKTLTEAIKLDPKWPLAYYQMAETFKADQKFDKAMEYYSKVAELKQLLPAKKGIADLYLKQKELPKAIAVYKELIRSGNADMETYDLLISVYQISGQLDTAEKWAKELCSRFPKNAYSYYRLGIFYSFATNYQEAETQLKKALSLSPNDISILKAQSLTCIRLGDKQRAINYARQIVKINPDDIENRFYLAGLLQDSRDTGAIEAYREILSRKPDHAFALNNLALLTLESGNPKEALRLAEKARLLEAGNGNILDTYGWLLFKNNDKKKSVPILQKAQSLVPKNPSVLYHLAVVYSETGKKPEAKQVLKQLLDLKIDFENLASAKELLEHLQK